MNRELNSYIGISPRKSYGLKFAKADIVADTMMRESHRFVFWISLVCLISGGILLTYYAYARLSSLVFYDAGLRQFERVQAEAKSRPKKVEEQKVDFSLWSPQRIQAFQATLELKQRQPIAVLELDRLRIRVPVFSGTDDFALDRGTGWIPGTSKLGQTGNIGIAGHRDGFFRPLKDVKVGDLIELQLYDKTMTFHVQSTEIITPDQIRVLLPTTETTLTLVTCYPFYFVGNAPKRFIVKATLQKPRIIQTN